MSTEFYTRTAQTAATLLGKYGTDLEFVRIEESTFDPATGEYSGGDNVSYMPKGLSVNMPQSLIDGTRILQDDRMFVIEGQTFTPLMSDKLKIGSEDWTIEEIKPVKPATIAVVYFVRVRK